MNHPTSAAAAMDYHQDDTHVFASAASAAGEDAASSCSSTSTSSCGFGGLSASDALDRIATMRLQEESDAYRTVDYFTPPLHHRHEEDGQPSQGSSGGSTGQPVDAECRTKMGGWCGQVVDFCQFSAETVCVAMNLLDRFLSKSLPTSPHAGAGAAHPRAVSARRSRKDYQLAAMTCLYVAVKLNEPVEMDTELVSELSRGCYSALEVATMETDILEALGWRVSGPTPMAFFGHFLALLPPPRHSGSHGSGGSSRAETVLLELGKRQSEPAAVDPALVPFHPSTVAVAALVNALEALPETDLTREDKIGLLRNVRDATAIDVASDEVCFVRSRLLESFADVGGGRQEEEATSHQEDRREEQQRCEEDAEPELTHEDEHYEHEEQQQKKEQQAPPPSKRRCSVTGAGADEASRHNSPICVSEDSFDV